MAGHTPEELKGCAKEATGAITGDTKLEREGKIDQASASATENLGNVADAVEHAVNSDRRHR